MPVLFVATLCGSFFFALALAAAGGLRAALTVSAAHFGLVLLKTLLVAASWTFVYYAMRALPISILSLIRRSNVVVSFAVGAWLFRERNLRNKAFALAAILAGVAILCLA